MEATVVTAVADAAVKAAPVLKMSGFLTAIGQIPLSTVINVAVFTGIAVFTAWVLIRRTIKIHKQAEKMESECGAFSGEVTVAEDILRNHNYVGNATIFDTLDPAMKGMAADMDPAAGQRVEGKGKKKKSKKRKPAALRTKKDLEDENAELVEALRGVVTGQKANLRREWVNYGKTMQKSGLAEIDEIARKMGLRVDTDDEFPPDVQSQFGDLL